MKTDNKNKQSKYAFNINDINAKKKFQGSLNDFQKLNRGLYDEIENQDISIKDNKNQLKKLKNKTIKEFVYTNKEIPDHWKTKLDYEQELLKMFVKDKNFLVYLGHGGGGDNFRTIKESEKNNNISPISNLLSKTPNLENKSLPKIESNNRTTNSQMKSGSTKHIARNIRFNDKKNYTDKEILGILDDFKNAYPLFDKEKEKNQGMHNSKETIENENHDIKSKTFYNTTRNNIFQNAFKNNNIKNNLPNKKKTITDFHPVGSFPNIKQKHNNRQNTFRQNIFTNLLPSNDKYKYSKTLLRKMGQGSSSASFRKKPNNYNLNNNIFLNSDNELFEKRVTINNPILLKYLEGISFFGPYFSYCPPCGNRNLEFYKNLEINQCLQIIQQIKKNKGKNIIINKKKSDTKKKEQNNDNQEMNDNISIKYNSGSVNQNNYESDNNSMIQQMSRDSKGSYEKEQYDMFN